MSNSAVIANYPLFHGFYPNGDPLIGGLLYTFQAGTSTPAAAYHDAAATQPHMNPIILDDRGEALVHIAHVMLWRLETPTGVQLWEVDNIGSGDAIAGGGGGGGGGIPPSTVGVNHGDVSIGLVA
jgi:hypothetical protein